MPHARAAMMSAFFVGKRSSRITHFLVAGSHLVAMMECFGIDSHCRRASCLYVVALTFTPNSEATIAYEDAQTPHNALQRQSALLGTAHHAKQVDALAGAQGVVAALEELIRNVPRDHLDAARTSISTRGARARIAAHQRARRRSIDNGSALRLVPRW